MGNEVHGERMVTIIQESNRDLFPEGDRAEPEPAMPMRLGTNGEAAQ